MLITKQISKCKILLVSSKVKIVQCVQLYDGNLVFLYFTIKSLTSFEGKLHLYPRYYSERLSVIRLFLLFMFLFYLKEQLQIVLVLGM